MNPLLGFTSPENMGKSVNEIDLLKMSTKKIEEGMLEGMMVARNTSIGPGKLYWDMVIGLSNNSDISMEEEDELLIRDHQEGGEGLKIVEDKFGEYEWPTFVLSELEEKRIH